MSIVSFQENLYPFCSASDPFVLTSNWKGFGNVLVEAIACGLPIISTRCPGGSREILEEGLYCELVSLGNVDALAGAIIQRLHVGITNTDKLKLIDKAKEYAVSAIVDKYLELSEC